MHDNFDRTFKMVAAGIIAYALVVISVLVIVGLVAAHFIEKYW